MKNILLIILTCFIFCLVGCSTDSSTDYTSGDRIVLSYDAPVCSTKDNVDKMINYISKNNEEGQNEMIERGEATILPKGTEVNIVKNGIIVEIQTKSGNEYFAPFEAIK